MPVAFERQLADCDTVCSRYQDGLGLPCARPVTLPPQHKAPARLQVATWQRPGKCHGKQGRALSLRIRTATLRDSLLEGVELPVPWWDKFCGGLEPGKAQAEGGVDDVTPRIGPDLH